MVVHVGHASLVVHAAVRRNVVAERRTVLGDHQRLVRVRRVQREEQLRQARRLDVPAHRRVRPGLLDELDIVDPDPRRRRGVPVAVGQHALAFPGEVPHAHRRVVVHAEDVEWHVDRREIAVAHKGPVGDVRSARQQVGRHVGKAQAASALRCGEFVAAVDQRLHPG